jgi:hypothetical protein
MVGDVNERFTRGKSSLWYWKEVLVVVALGVFGTVFWRRRQEMKRVASLIAVVAAAFSLGFYTARSPLLVKEDMPSAKAITEQAALHRKQVFGTLEFLQGELRQAEARYTAEPTVERRRERDHLKEKLEKVLLIQKTAPADR